LSLVPFMMLAAEHFFDLVPKATPAVVAARLCQLKTLLDCRHATVVKPVKEQDDPAAVAVDSNAGGCIVAR